MSAIVLLSGPIASGKTSLADELIDQHGFKRLRSSDYLKVLCRDQGLEVSRFNLQQLGDRLDEDTDFRWLVDAVGQRQIAADPQQKLWLIDSVRKQQQVSHFREAFGDAVIHVHVWAPDEVLRKRFESRRNSGTHSEGSTDYETAVSHANEAAARALIQVADLEIDLSTIDPRRGAQQVVDHLARKR